MQRIVILVLTLGCLLAGPTWGHAVDLTGSWTGKLKCQFLEDGQATEKATLKDVIMNVTQSGTDVNAQLINPVDGMPELLDGVAITDASKANQGRASMIGCGAESNPIAAGMAHVKIKENPNSGKSTMRGTLVAGDKTPGGVIFTNAVAGACKLTLKRTSAADPGIGPCPP